MLVINSMNISNKTIEYEPTIKKAKDIWLINDPNTLNQKIIN